MFTCDEDVADDVTDLFNFLTGYSDVSRFRKLLVAPLNMRTRLEKLIRREIDHAQFGRGGRLVFKANSLVDRRLIDLLYEASAAGVKVDLIIRGLCCLRAGLPELSENIRVRSVVGRFLEHSRVYYFQNAGKEEVFLGSADLMTRNLDRRVEVLFPVKSPTLIRRLVDDILEAYLQDNVKAREMTADGSYVRLVPAKGDPPRLSQDRLLTHSRGS